MIKAAQDAQRDDGSGFTEAAYANLLDRAAVRYRFIDYSVEVRENVCIWRHDIDYSPHRARALARIEAARKLRCIYHVLLDSSHYNIFEPKIVGILKEIAGMGHEIGLHFDWDVFDRPASITEQQAHERIFFEKGVVQTVLNVPVRSISFHNHALNTDHVMGTDTICGMLNAAAPRIQDQFKYCSDSNGIWRYDRLHDLLSGHPIPRLHVLTHPVWWVPEPMRPVDRFRRAVDGHAEANMRFYLGLMKRDGRLAGIAKRLGIDSVTLRTLDQDG